MSTPPKEGLLDQLRALVRDALDYLNKTLELQQAKFTAFALSGVVFSLQIVVAFVLGTAAFILFNVAIGLALTNWLGSSLWAILTLGIFYTILSVALSYKAVRWLSRLKS